MFDMMKFSGDKVHNDDFAQNIFDVSDIIGVLSVRKDGDEYIVNDDEPTGKLLIYREDGKDYALYIENSVETSCVVDLL